MTLGGVSIGGAIALILAGRRNPRVVCVVAMNPYDYARGRGLARSSWAGWMIMMTTAIPVIGETVMRLRTFSLSKIIFQGGVANPKSIPPALLKEMHVVGTGLAIIGPSSACFAMPRVGRKQPRSMHRSGYRCVFSGATRIGPDPANASRIAAGSQTSRW